MSVFQFKYFNIKQERSAMKVGTDALLLSVALDPEIEPLNVLDVGTGTGVLSLVMAQRFLNASIDGVELDELTAEECRFNFEQSKWRDRLRLFTADFLSWDTKVQYDLIISNPPYYTSLNPNTDERKANSRHIKSLPMEPFAQKCDQLLSESGTIWLIFPNADRSLWYEAFHKYHLAPGIEINIRGKEGESYKRTITALSRQPYETKYSEITVRKIDGRYTDQYKLLTAELHDRILD